jgi:hypothetical protein
MSSLAPVLNRLLIRRALANAPGSSLRELQQRALARALATAQGTALGRHLGLPGLRTVAEYQRRVPLQHHADLQPFWERSQTGETNVVSREPVIHFALTSGVTGRGKLVPVTRTSLRGLRRGMRGALAPYLRAAPASRVLVKRALMVAGRSRIGRTAGGIPFGMLSGIMIDRSSPLVRWRGLPSLATLNLDSWAAKIAAMAREATGKEVGMLAGIPSSVLAFLTGAKAEMKRDDFLRLAGGLELLVCSGVSYLPYREALEATLERSVSWLNVYSASEGFLGSQAAEAADALELSAQSIFFELVPHDDYLAGRYARRLLLGDCVAGSDYVPLITNGYGAFSYVVGDLLHCVAGGERPRFRLAGRLQLTLNVVTEKTTVQAIESTMLELSRELGVAPPEFLVTARVVAGRQHYLWLVEDTAAWRRRGQAWIERRLDDILVRHNEHYGHFINGALGRSQLVFVDGRRFEVWAAGRNADSGHRKVPRIVPAYRDVADLVSGSEAVATVPG